MDIHSELNCSSCGSAGAIAATRMSELVWGIKNGDLEQVRDIVENKASMTMLTLKTFRGTRTHISTA